MGSLLECLEVFAVAGLITALFHQELAAIVKNQAVTEKTPLIRAFSVTDTELRLNRDHFTERDLRILQGILARTKYETITREQNIGLSTLKKQLTSLLSLLEVQDRLQFLELYGKHALVWEAQEPGGGDTEQREASIVEFRLGNSKNKNL
jgi:DNA-binding NarL/FixJ family response regulator